MYRACWKREIKDGEYAVTMNELTTLPHANSLAEAHRRISNDETWVEDETGKRV